MAFGGKRRRRAAEQGGHTPEPQGVFGMPRTDLGLAVADVQVCERGARMLKVLSKEESFLLLRRKFVALRDKRVIDLCNQGRKYPAIVTSVDREGKSFRVIPLDEKGIDDVLGGRLPEEVVVKIPETADEVHPMWNEF